MTEISRLKFIQWRPIGVCDTGAGKERKAKMFARHDLACVTDPEVKRENWRQQPKVMELIQRYASEVAELSTLTNGMQSPEIAEIKLVGAVLGHDQTPNLNQESEEGRVQFFQVSFRDGKTKKTSTKKWKKIKKGVKDETIISNFILGRNYFYSAFVDDVVFWSRNRTRKTGNEQSPGSDIKKYFNGSSRRTLGYFCSNLAGNSSGIELYIRKEIKIVTEIIF